MTPPPEAGPGGGPARIDIIAKLKQALNHMLGRAIFEEEAKKAAKKYKKEQEDYESAAQRAAEKEQQKQKDLERAYHNVRSAQVAELSADMSRTARAKEVSDKLDEVVVKDEIVSEGAGYFVDSLRDENVREGLKDLLGRSASAREAVDVLITKGREVHGDARQLIALSQTLLYESTEAERNRIRPLLDKIALRATDLLKDQITVENHQRAQYRQPGIDVIGYLKKQKELYLPEKKKI